MALLSGCSSRLHTATVSGSETRNVPVTQLESEIVTVEDLISQPIQIEPGLDIPAVEPPKSVPSPTVPQEIFAASKSNEGSSIPQESLSASVANPDVPVVVSPIPKSKLLDTPPVEKPQVDVPSMSAPPSGQKPIQVAKVMPQEPEQVEIIAEALDAALSDIYFNYDQFEIREDAGTLLKANAQLLSAKFAEAQIVIEGHCDERGTQSYNMVLGKRRAKAVKHFLQDLGVPAENLQVVSYGKEKPFCTDQTEVCWQENRRGHFVIQ
jgi:peptidoglycan-associated lipoprotein